MERISKNSVGLAGEFAVLSQLAFHGFDASLTLGHTKNIDVLVFDPKTKKRCEIEVKTNLEFRKTDRFSDSKLFGKFVAGWQMDEKHERVSDPNLFYCFVNIKAPDPKNPVFRFFIVPSKIVAKYVREEHRLWLKSDSSHRTTSRRQFRIGLQNDRPVAVPAPLADKFENNWNIWL